MFQEKTGIVLSLALLTAPIVGCATGPSGGLRASDPLVERASRLATASLSDAMDQVLGQRGFLAPALRPVGSAARMCGPAVTVLSRPSAEKQPPTEALRIIDDAEPGSVLVLVMEGAAAEEVAAFGGIMCTGSIVNGLAGAVLDASCRDVVEIAEAGFPVFARSIVPSSSVGRYVNVAAQEPVTCGGVTVNPGDIIVADWDGIVVVPKVRADEVLTRAEELEAKEAETMNAVRELKSLQKARERTNRI